MNKGFFKRVCALVLFMTTLFPFASCGKETYYEATVVYYVNPVKEDDSQFGPYDYGQFVMGNLIELLNSQVFVEILTESMPNCPEKENADGELNKAYKSHFRTVEESVEFSWENNFITAEISVSGSKGKSFAEELLEAVKTQLPEYVIENIMLPKKEGYVETRCEKVSSLDEIVKVEK